MEQIKHQKEILKEFGQVFKEIAFQNRENRGAVILKWSFSNGFIDGVEHTYSKLGEIKKYCFDTAVKMVEDYDLKKEFVIIFIGEDNRQDCYRIKEMKGNKK